MTVHESGLVRRLMQRAEQELKQRPGRVESLRFEIGALSDADPEWLAEGARHHALENWGYAPRVVVERSDDPTAQDALGVTLRSIRMEG